MDSLVYFIFQSCGPVFSAIFQNIQSRQKMSSAAFFVFKSKPQWKKYKSDRYGFQGCLGGSGLRRSKKNSILRLDALTLVGPTGVQLLDFFAVDVAVEYKSCFISVWNLDLYAVLMH